jgi:SAM-dependent methyltransferase
MPSIQFNQQAWGTYSWPSRGDEWSAPWGGAEAQWHNSILPRIRHFVPTGTILEIAPGHGRWSAFLIELANNYVGVDLAQECVDACQERFRAASNATFFVNDGKSLACAADHSVDFAFSFDSLVHAEIASLAAYSFELARKLKPNGVAFLHHSNLGESRVRYISKLGWRFELIGKGLRRLGLSRFDHWRAPSVSAQEVAKVAASAGLVCIGQELINWRTKRRTIDCFSILTLPGSKYAPSQPKIVRNTSFMCEAGSSRAIAAWQSHLDRLD